MFVTGNAKGKKRALELDQSVKENTQDEDDGLTALERERAALIARNRERLMALGIPSLRAELEASGGGAAGSAAGSKKAKKGKPAHEAKPRVKVKREVGAEEQPFRRSTRLQESQQQPKPQKESAPERLDRELGQFVVEGVCPRCGRQMERGHRQHLQACRGANPRAAPRRPYDPALEELSQEERRDPHDLLLARMKHLHLDCLMELTQDEAKFAVLGSTGNHYTVTLKDDKHTCACLDYRFRRHNCKHICLVLNQLGIMDRPTEWREAVEGRMMELVEQQRQQQAMTQAVPPRSKGEDVALKLL